MTIVFQRPHMLVQGAAVLVSAFALFFDLTFTVPLMEAVFSSFGKPLVPLGVFFASAAWAVGFVTIIRLFKPTYLAVSTLVRVHLPLNLLWLAHIGRDASHDMFVKLVLATVSVLVAVELLRAFWKPALLKNPSVKRKTEWLVVLVACAALAIFYYSHYENRSHFNDEAPFGWDDWNYQQEAVNLAKGHGFPVAGGVEEFQVYKFKKIPRQTRKTFKEQQKRFMSNGENGGYHSYYRAPGYPLYAGLFYRVFGVSPKLLKISHLVLFVLVSAFLPLIGFVCLRLPGFVCGITTGYFFIEAHFHTAQRILTEPFMAFMVFVLIISWILFEKLQNHVSIIVLGVVSGMCMLTKGSFVFVPGLVVLYLLYVLSKRQRAYRLIITYILSTAVVVGSWSVFVRVQSDEWIIISTQGERVLPQGNNPACIEDGGWCKKGLEYYKTKELWRKSSTEKVLTFWWRYKTSLPTLFSNKIRSAFGKNTAFGLLLVLLIVNLLWRTPLTSQHNTAIAGELEKATSKSKAGESSTPKKQVEKKKSWISLLRGVLKTKSAVLPFYNLSILTSFGVILFVIARYSGEGLLIGFPENPSALLSIVFALLVYRVFKSRETRHHPPSPIAYILIANFILITLVVFGLPRFIIPIDYVILLSYYFQAVIASNAILDWIGNLAKGQRDRTPFASNLHL